MLIKAFILEIIVDLIHSSRETHFQEISFGKLKLTNNKGASNNNGQVSGSSAHFSLSHTHTHLYTLVPA